MKVGHHRPNSLQVESQISMAYPPNPELILNNHSQNESMNKDWKYPSLCSDSYPKWSHPSGDCLIIFWVLLISDFIVRPERKIQLHCGKSSFRE
jgi:hypothetical protein